MTKREAFHAAFNNEKTNRFCHMEHGFWEESYDRYRAEGLSESICRPAFASVSKGDLFEYFDILKFGYIRPDTYFQPQLEPVVLEETESYSIIKNGNGVTLKTAKNSLPQELEFEIKDMESYKKYRENLTAPSLDIRLPQTVRDSVKDYAKQGDYSAVCTHMDGFFAYPREIMGVQNTLMQFYDDPDLMHIMLNDRADFYIKVYEPILKEITPDFAFIWEDMCFKNGPLVSPAIFEEFMLPCYKKIISFLHDHGVKNIIVDSDGDVLKLVPLWIEAGVNGLLPFEVQSGMDVVKIGEMFPELVLIGGINKYELFKTKADIDAELNRVLPAMAKRGRYIPTLDHWVPPEISLENFEYYNEKVNSFKL